MVRNLVRFWIENGEWMSYAGIGLLVAASVAAMLKWTDRWMAL